MAPDDPHVPESGKQHSHEINHWCHGIFQGMPICLGQILADVLNSLPQPNHLEVVVHMLVGFCQAISQLVFGLSGEAGCLDRAFGSPFSSADLFGQKCWRSFGLFYHSAADGTTFPHGPPLGWNLQLSNAVAWWQRKGGQWQKLACAKINKSWWLVGLDLPLGQQAWPSLCTYKNI